MNQKTYPTIGVCGLDCALCLRYYTAGTSRCPGCFGLDFAAKHPSCSFITCCVKKKNLEVCAQCLEFPCLKFEGAGKGDSFLTYRKVMPNLEFIKKRGIEKFIERQKKRTGLLEEMLEDFDDGRSKSFYCLAATLLKIPDLEKALPCARQEIKINKVETEDIKAKAKILKKILNEIAFKEEIELKLRKR